MAEDQDIQLIWMEQSDLHRLIELDRSEKVSLTFQIVDGELQEKEVDWDVPTWLPEGDGDHSVSEQIEFCREHLKQNGLMLGALDRGLLVGAGIVRPKIQKNMAQLAFLHVSRAYRQHGLGARLADELSNIARKEGATSIYVSSTPSGSAVGFYLSQGFRVVQEVDPDLFALEPEDIHLIKDL
jgi:ribosomal protein S18 acetylase RimI-like enzyme